MRIKTLQTIAGVLIGLGLALMVVLFSQPIYSIFGALIFLSGSILFPFSYLLGTEPKEENKP